MRPKGIQPINFVFGMLMGAADVIPGVSGGTVALIVGIYERLINSIRAVASAAANVVRGKLADARAAIRRAEWGFLLPLMGGIVTAIVIGARVLVPLLEQYPVQFRALFFGLIAASVLAPWERIRERDPRIYLTMAAGAVVAFILVGFPPGEIADPGLLTVFLAASVAICAMILPGVSGSFLLLVMGMYTPTLRALNEGNLVYVGVFILGCAVGLGLFSKLLSFLLSRYHDLTMATLIGLMLGSLRTLWPFQDESRALLAPPSGAAFLIAFGLAALGFILVLSLLAFGRRAVARREAHRSVDTAQGQL